MILVYTYIIKGRKETLKNQRREDMLNENMVYNWELMKAREKSTAWLKNWIWLASTGQPIPGCLSVESLRVVLIERGEDGKGYHNT